uniref:Uncharacterized protein n=1 Tax=Eutreptiella gymnastica TaxID=73025 RepID=A0A7S1HWE0_9EUGL
MLSWTIVTVWVCWVGQHQVKHLCKKLRLLQSPRPEKIPQKDKPPPPSYPTRAGRLAVARGTRAQVGDSREVGRPPSLEKGTEACPRAPGSTGLRRLPCLQPGMPSSAGHRVAQCIA